MHTFHAGRDVSPIGASRFERPFTALSHATWATGSATSTERSDIVLHSTQPSTSTTASNANSQTPASSVANSFEADLAGITGPLCDGLQECDDWSERFRPDPDCYYEDSDDCPDRATLAAAREIPLYDDQGVSRPFGAIYEPALAYHQRQLVIFIRHFYCGACQAYLKALTESISTRDYFSIPIPTSIMVIGCGMPDLIRQYRKFTNCPFPMYADPSRMLFRLFGMNKTMKIGRERPEYMKDISTLAWVNGQAKTIQRSLNDPDGIRKRDIFRGGNPMQIGGEFLFEEGEVIWCHRMRHYRNHAEVATVRRILQLDD